MITGPLRGLDKGCEFQPRALDRREIDIAGLPPVPRAAAAEYDRRDMMVVNPPTSGSLFPTSTECICGTGGDGVSTNVFFETGVATHSMPFIFEELGEKLAPMAAGLGSVGGGGCIWILE